MSRQSAPLSAAVLAAALAAACAGPPASDAAASDAAARASEAAQPAPSVAVAGKPVAPFAVDYVLLGTPAVGEALDVRITVRPSSPMSDLRLQAAGGEGLQVAPEDADQSAPSATRDAPAEWLVSVVPAAEGTLQLKLTVDGVLEDRRQARSIVVPVRVNAGVAAKGASSVQAEPKADAGQGGGDQSNGSGTGNGQGQGQGEGLIHLHSDE